jgi:hypothetical protein
MSLLRNCGKKAHFEAAALGTARTGNFTSFHWGEI